MPSPLPLPPTPGDGRTPPHAITLDAMSVAVRIEVDPAASWLHHHLRTAWVRCLREPPTAAPVATLRYLDPEAHLSPSLPSEITTRVTLAALHGLRGHKLLFHAAALADPDTGLTAVLVAPSGTGKTRAARVLGRQLEYLSDETTCVDPHDLTVTAYPKPLSIITDPQRPKAQVSPDQLGLLSQTGPASMNSLLVLVRDPRATHAQLSEPLPLRDALELLCPNISALQALPHPLSTLLDVIRRVGGVRTLRYRDIDTAAEHVVQAVRTPATEPSTAVAPRSWVNPTPLPFHDHTAPDSLAAAPVPSFDAVVPAQHAGAPHRVAPCHWVEAVENSEDPSTLILMLADRVLVLGALAAQVWHECREHGERTVAQVHRATVRRNGAHPDAPALVEQCVGTLVRAGVLRPADGA